MKTSTRSDYERRVDSVIRLLMLSLDEAPSTRDLAARSCFSEFHFQRAFRQVVGESPAAFRRRLQMERAAFRLMTTRTRVTAIALDAGYESLEPFTRAFRRAYGVSPTGFRLLELTRYRLPSPSGIHFRPAVMTGPCPEGEYEVDLFDRLIDNDAWTIRQLVLKAQQLTDEQLDHPFEPHGQTVREILERLVYQKEMWVAAMDGQELLESTDRSARGMLARLDRAAPRFTEIARQVRERRQWDETFTDAVCEPPETFTFGGAFAHVITRSAHRCYTVIEMMKGLGVKDLISGDPIEWDRSRFRAAAPA